jgi:hypothetical protein
MHLHKQMSPPQILQMNSVSPLQVPLLLAILPTKIMQEALFCPLVNVKVKIFSPLNLI